MTKMRFIMRLPVWHLHLMANICSAQLQEKIQFPCMRLMQKQDFSRKKFTLPISGDYPKDLVIFPDNQHIAIANHASNTITTFKVDYEKNIIVMNDKPHKVETPNSIHMWPVPQDFDAVEPLADAGR